MFQVRVISIIQRINKRNAYHQKQTDEIGGKGAAHTFATHHGQVGDQENDTKFKIKVPI